MKVKVVVTLKNGVLDPQGKAIQQTLKSMGFNNAKEVRQGKYFNIEMDIEDEKKAKENFLNNNNKNNDEECLTCSA